MANAKILEKKQAIVDEIKDRVNNAKSVILFDYHGITDEEIKSLRIKLRDAGADYKVYKNTLMARAFKDLDIDFASCLEGPSALAYSEDQIAPIKVLSDFAKEHPTITLKIGYVDGEVADSEKLAKYATIPSREGLLTMLAGGMIEIPKKLAIALDFYAKQKEENE